MLVARALAGREEGFRGLLAHHRDPVHRLIRAQIGDADAALDVTQESFIAAFAHLHRYDPARPFRHWILRIALNKARDWRRRRKVRGFLIRAAVVDDGTQVADGTPDPLQTAAARQELARTRRAIDALPDKLRSVLLLRTIEGMNQAEVAALLGISQKAVETRLYRARVKLIDMLRDDGTARV